MFPQLDPSKLDPRALQELTELVRSLPQQTLFKLQSLMHNQMAGLDVRHELVQLEQELPPGFREKMMQLMLRSPDAFSAATAGGTLDSGPKQTPVQQADLESKVSSPSGTRSIRDARITILQAIKDHALGIDQAYDILFPGD